MTTYAELTTQIRNWTEVDDNVFSSTIIDDFIQNSEYRLMTELDLDAFRRVDQSTLTSGNNFLSTPTGILYIRYLRTRDADNDFNYLLQKNITLNKKGYFIAFILGLLSLANMTFMICTFFLLFSNFKNKDININLIMHSIFVVIIVFLPKIFWNYYISYQGFDPYNAATEYWRQFIWLKDFILVSYENINYNLEGGEYYCMSVPLFMKCYLMDFLNTLIYLGGPVILIIINLIFEKDSKSKKYSKDLKNIIFVSLTMFSFWAFMGWYPPLRLNLYSLGFLVTLILATQLLNNSPTKRESLYFSIHFLYFLSLNHWNNLDIVSFNFGILTSYVLIVVYLLSLRNNYLTSSKP